MTASKRFAPTFFGSLVLALMLSACAESPPPKPAPKPATGTASIPARVCTADQGPDRAMCVMMIGAERTILADGKFGKKVCSPVDPHDLSDTYSVMKWIRAHPERQDEELGDITDEVLAQLHPCP